MHYYCVQGRLILSKTLIHSQWLRVVQGAQSSQRLHQKIDVTGERLAFGNW